MTDRVERAVAFLREHGGEYHTGDGLLMAVVTHLPGITAEEVARAADLTRREKHAEGAGMLADADALDAVSDLQRGLA